MRKKKDYTTRECINLKSMTDPSKEQTFKAYFWSKYSTCNSVSCPLSHPRSPFLTRLVPIRRLETAIQRYQARRNMHSERREIFTKYLSYGGVDISPKMFGGNDERDRQDMDKDEIITAVAQSTVPEDRANWDVDFEAVVKGFLCALSFFHLRLRYVLQLTIVLGPPCSRAS